jgi:bacterioferritin
MNFVRDLEAIRDRARDDMIKGAVTQDYQLDASRAISVLNSALATEIMCTLRYMFHYFMASGIHSHAVKGEFKEHADDEREHAERLAERIKQLGGKPEMNPAVVSEASFTEYKEGKSLADMIREDLIAERVVIETYREMAAFFGEKDPTTRLMIEQILANEEEHADDLADLLFAVEPESGEAVRRLYFEDEIPHISNAGSTQAGRRKQVDPKDREVVARKRS